MRKLFLILPGLLLVNCFARAAEQHYTTRVIAIDEKFNSYMDDIDSSYAQEYDHVTKLKRSRIAVNQEHKGEPLNSVLDNEEFSSQAINCTTLAQDIQVLQDMGGETESEEAKLDKCQTSLSRMQLHALATTYWAADLEWTSSHYSLGDSVKELEQLYLYSHNLRITAYVEAEHRRLRIAYGSAQRNLEGAHARAVARAAEARDEEVAESKQRFAMAMSAFAQGYLNARATNNAAQTIYQPSAGTYTVAPSRARACSSDFSCGVGAKCVKANYSGIGHCATAVTAYGGRIYDMLDMSSIFVKIPTDADCHGVSDCPLGFQCDTDSGACVR